jgi:hypothetical protein
MRFAILVLGFVLLAGTAQAGCADYFEARRLNEQAKGDLFREMGGTAATLVACTAACESQPSSEKPGCALTSCGMACLVIGFDNCMQFFTRAAAIADQEAQVREFGARHQCTP